MRSIYKSIFISPKIKDLLNSKREINSIYTTSRESTIIDNWYQKNFFVHNGISFKKVLIQENMTKYNFKIGEFAYTRKICKGKKKKNKKKNFKK